MTVLTNLELTPNRRGKLRAFTLTEMAIVLGIIGIILGAIWVAASAVYENNRTARARAQVMQIVNAFKSIYGGKRVNIADWTDLTALAINNGFVPQEMVNGSTAVGPWSGSVVTIYSNQSWNGIVVYYNNLAQTACNHFANAVGTTNPGLIYVVINGQARLLPPIGVNSAFTTADVNTYCNLATGNYVYVIYSMN